MAFFKVLGQRGGVTVARYVEADSLLEAAVDHQLFGSDSQYPHMPLPPLAIVRVPGPPARCRCWRAAWTDYPPAYFTQLLEQLARERSERL